VLVVHMGGGGLLVALDEGVEIHRDAVVLDVAVDLLRLLLVQRDVIGPGELLRQVLVPQLGSQAASAKPWWNRSVASGP